VKKILIITYGYPNFGGQATTAYNLMKLLNENNFAAKTIYIIDNHQANIDPHDTGDTHKIVLKKNVIHSVYNIYRKKKIKFLSTQIPFIRKFYFLIRVVMKVKIFILKKQFQPDLVITNVPNYNDWVSKLFNKTAVIIGSSPYSGELAITGVDTQSFLQNPELIKKHLFKNHITNFGNSFVIFNSKLTQHVYKMLGSKSEKDQYQYQYFNFAPYIKTNSQSFLGENVEYSNDIIIYGISAIAGLGIFSHLQREKWLLPDTNGNGSSCGSSGCSGGGGCGGGCGGCGGD